MSLFQVTQSQSDLPEVALFSKSINSNVVNVCDLSNNVSYTLPSVAPEGDSVLRFTAGSLVFSSTSNFELTDSGTVFPVSPVNGQMFFYDVEAKPLWYVASVASWVYADGSPFVPSP